MWEQRLLCLLPEKYKRILDAIDGDSASEKSNLVVTVVADTGDKPVIPNPYS